MWSGKTLGTSLSYSFLTCKIGGMGIPIMMGLWWELKESLYPGMLSHPEIVVTAHRKLRVWSPPRLSSGVDFLLRTPTISSPLGQWGPGDWSGFSTMAESSKPDLHLHSFSSPPAHLCSVFSRSDFAFINLRFSLILAFFFFNPYLLCRAKIEWNIQGPIT